MCEHGFIGACAVCDGMGQQPDRVDVNDFVKQIEPCDRCSANAWMHVQGGPDELSGYECYECGKGFIPDKAQQPIRFESLPIDAQEYLEYLSELES